MKELRTAWKRLNAEMIDPVGVLGTAIRYRLWKWGIWTSSIFVDTPTARLPVKEYYKAEHLDPSPAGKE